MKYIPKELAKTSDISKGEYNRKSFLKEALSVTIVLTLLYLLLGSLADLIAEKIPDKYEKNYFSSLPESKNGLSPEYERAKKVFTKLVENSELRDLSYTFFLFDLAQPNAFAFPGGGVGITSSLLQNVTSEKGLAMVLAHELGHHQNRHCLKRLGRILIFQIVKSVLLGADSEAIIDYSFLAAESGYSQKQERVADEFGMRLIHELYGDTEGALEFFEMIYKEYESDNPKWFSFFSSHPSTPDRMNYLKELGKRMR